MADFRGTEAPDAREKILATACRLFAHQGYENTSLSQVAREASVSKALIFWHFDTKEKLFESALRRTLEPYSISFDELEGLDEPAQLGVVIDEFYAFVRENVYSVRFFLGLMVREEKEPGEVVKRVSELYGLFRNLIAGIIERGQRNGTFRAAMPAGLEATLIMASLAGILVQQFMNEHAGQDARALLEHLRSSVLQRLCA